MRRPSTKRTYDDASAAATSAAVAAGGGAPSKRILEVRSFEGQKHARTHARITSARLTPALNPRVRTAAAAAGTIDPNAFRPLSVARRSR